MGGKCQLALTGGPENPVENGAAALAALLQGVGIVPLAQRLALHCVEGQALATHSH